MATKINWVKADKGGPNSVTDRRDFPLGVVLGLMPVKIAPFAKLSLKKESKDGGKVKKR